MSRRVWKTLRVVVSMRTRLPIRSRDFRDKIYTHVKDCWSHEKTKMNVSKISAVDYNMAKRHLK